jgi:hypothetical protein
VIRSRLTAPLVLLALTIGVFWKLVLTRQYTWVDSPDNAFQVAPWLQAQAAAWHRGEWLLWDPFLAGGQSLIGQMQPGAVNPLNWLLFLMPLHHGFLGVATLNRYFVLIHFFAALAAYFLCRDLGRSRTASILAASAYAFAGYVGTTQWPQMISASLWAPLALLFTLRATRGQRPTGSALLSGFFLGVEWLAGHHQLPLFTTLAIAGIWIFQAARAKTGRLRVERSVLFAGLVVMMIAAGALQTFPAYSYGQTAVRWVGASQALKFNEAVPYSVHDEYSLQPWSVLGIFINGIFTSSNPFVGIVVFFLALSGIALARDQLPVRILAFIALGALLFALASYSLFGGILYAVVPMVDKARVPAMAMFIFELAVCPLAAFGLDALPNALESNWIRRATAAVGVIAALLWIFVFAAAATKLPLTARLAQVAMAALTAALLYGLLVMMRSGVARSPAWLVVLMMIEIGPVATLDRQNIDTGWHFWPQIARDVDIAQFLKTRPGPFRVEVKEDDVPYNFGDWYGVETFLGYVASLPEPFTRVLGEPRARQLLGVEYYIAKTPSGPEQREILADQGGIKLFETSGALPRVRAVHEVTAISDPKQIPATLNAIDLARAAFVVNEKPPVLENCSGDRVSMAHAAAQSVDIDASMACRGMIILGNAYSKDWVARVDGQPAKIYAADSFITGVAVDGGQHRVELRYRPVSVYLGALLTTLAALMALGIWRASRQGDIH